MVEQLIVKLNREKVTAAEYQNSRTSADVEIRTQPRVVRDEGGNHWTRR